MMGYKGNELEVTKKAMQLAEHSFRLTMNINRYPKKIRHSLVDRIQIKSMDIYECLMEANRIDLKFFKKQRLEMQTKAITYCDQLNFYIEMSHKLNLIDVDSMEYWSKMVSGIKHMALAWRTTDRNRKI